ncbi:hypothetical protein GGR56DRAFT_464745 [Xylariaceae sp. FL0804]|nr:hypothetical protein GGR56DRAFT_464745 [Xylariaceae sp. FL0804]
MAVGAYTYTSPPRPWAFVSLLSLLVKATTEAVDNDGTIPCQPAARAARSGDDHDVTDFYKKKSNLHDLNGSSSTDLSTLTHAQFLATYRLFLHITLFRGPGLSTLCARIRCCPRVQRKSCVPCLMPPRASRTR